jgi:hypothetical protein
VDEGYCVMLGTHLFGLPEVSQALLEPAAGGGIRVAARLFSHCVMEWRSLLQVRGECLYFHVNTIFIYITHISIHYVYAFIHFKLFSDSNINLVILNS